MHCPINGKPCGKHKCLEVAKGGSKHLVCGDCLHDGSVSVQEYVEECKDCGIRLHEVITDGRLGCPKCYENFSDTIGYVIASAQHGDSSICHRGRVSSRFVMERAKSTPVQDFVAELELEIEAACGREDYLVAAELKSKLGRFLEISKEGGRDSQGELALFIFNYWTGSD
jgi:protein-arginine kinase activator protein McsA